MGSDYPSGFVEDSAGRWANVREVSKNQWVTSQRQRPRGIERIDGAEIVSGECLALARTEIERAVAQRIESASGDDAVVSTHESWDRAVSTAERPVTKTSRDPGESHRRRIHTVSFDPIEDEWIDALVNLLSDAGYPKAGRSEIVRVGVRGLQDALAGRTRSEILKFFVLRDAEWLLASFHGTLRLPFD